MCVTFEIISIVVLSWKNVGSLKGCSTLIYRLHSLLADHNQIYYFVFYSFVGPIKDASGFRFNYIICLLSFCMYEDKKPLCG